jgi:putative endonuclease
MGYTYMLWCNDNTFYVGSTKNIIRRFKQHCNGSGANYTKKRRPLSLIYIEEYPRIDMAFYREKQLQKWSHKKKLALVKDDYLKIKELSKKIFGNHHVFRIPNVP